MRLGVESLDVRCCPRAATVTALGPAPAEPGIESEPPSVRPNFLLIVTDDQRVDTMRAMPQTRHLLARSGVRFANSFVTTPLCCPSRSSLLTGQYAHNHGVRGNRPPNGGFELFRDGSTLATWLHDAGYRTGLFGKYLNGYPEGGNEDYVPPGWDEFQATVSVRGAGAPFFDYDIAGTGPRRHYGTEPADYSTDVLAALVIDFIEGAEQNDDQPFFAYFAPQAPHAPTTPAPRHAGTLDTLEPHRPPSFDEPDLQDKPMWLNRGPLSQNEIEAVAQLRQDTYESLFAVDEAIAQFVSTLTDTAELDRTVIIFTSDNGFQWGEHRRIGKDLPYEESIQVPLVIRDGRSPVRRRVGRLALNIDLAPTIAEMAGLKPPRTVDGRSLVPLLAGNPAVSWRSEFLVEGFRRQHGYTALRSKGWKYIEHDSGERELYDLRTDPYELNSLHDDESREPLIREMANRLQLLRECHADSCRA